jgi:hypothetical protein
MKSSELTFIKANRQQRTLVAVFLKHDNYTLLMILAFDPSDLYSHRLWNLTKYSALSDDRKMVDYEVGVYEHRASGLWIS